jgi:hypothetical protein
MPAFLFLAIIPPNPFGADRIAEEEAMIHNAVQLENFTYLRWRPAI